MAAQPGRPIRTAREEKMREDANESWPVHGSALMTKKQAKGGALGTLTFALIGAVIGGLVGLVPMLIPDMLLRVVVFAAVGATAGSVIGFIAGAGVAPDEGPGTGGPPVRR